MYHFVKKDPLASQSLYLAGERFNGHYDPTNRCGAELRSRGGYKVKWRRDWSHRITVIIYYHFPGLFQSTMPAPTGEERKKCHAARDKYFACLSSNENDESACSKEKDQYTAVCPAAWVSFISHGIVTFVL